MSRRRPTVGAACYADGVTRTLALALATLVAACDTSPRPEPSKPDTARVAAAATTKKKPVYLKAEAGPDAASLIKQAAERASSSGQTLLVYVGATWCEPCNRFHEAIEQGKLDDAFANIVFYEFDKDHDDERLKAAGYTSRLIPLFAAPGPDGRASGRQIEGSIKGPGAVGEITPRLQGLLGKR